MCVITRETFLQSFTLLKIKDPIVLQLFFGTFHFLTKPVHGENTKVKDTVVLYNWAQFHLLSADFTAVSQTKYFLRFPFYIPKNWHSFNLSRKKENFYFIYFQWNCLLSFLKCLKNYHETSIWNISFLLISTEFHCKIKLYLIKNKFLKYKISVFINFTFFVNLYL